MRRLSAGGLGLMAVLLVPNVSSGSLISYAFTGVIRETLQETSVWDGEQFVTTTTPLASVGGINAGDLFFGTFQIETNDAGVDPIPSPAEGFYSLTGSLVSSMSVTIDDLTFTAGPGAVATRNNVDVPGISPNADILQYMPGSLTTMPAGWNSSSTFLGIGFLDASGTLFPTDALPTSFNAADFDLGELSLSFISSVSFPGGSLPATVRILGDINLQAVPEPSSMLFAGTAAAAGLLLRRRKRAAAAAKA